MFRLVICIFVCLLTYAVQFSRGTFHPSPVFPYHHSLNRQTTLAHTNKTTYPLNITLGQQKYSIHLPSLSASKLSHNLHGNVQVNSSVNKPVNNSTRESRHLLQHLLYGLSHGGVKAASGSVSATHSFNLFGKQFNYAMGLSYGKPYYHVVSEVPGPYPNPDSTRPPEPEPTESPEGSDGDGNDDDDDDDSSDDDDDDDDDDYDSDNASVSNYSKKSDEQSGCGKHRGDSHDCNTSGSYENLTHKKKKKKIRKGTEKPEPETTSSSNRKKKQKNKNKKVPEKLQKLEPTIKDNAPTRNRAKIRNNVVMPSTLWDLINYRTDRKSKDIHFPTPGNAPNTHLLSADKLKQLSKISKISV